MLCPTCGSRNTVKNGVKRDMQEHLCRPCKATNGTGGYFYTPVGTFGRLAKYLSLDIETTPVRALLWGLYKGQHPGIHQIISDWSVISWSAKWLFSDKVLSGLVTPKEITAKIYPNGDENGVYVADDKRVMGEIWKLLDQADVVIAHNGDRFDLRKLKARFWQHKMPAPMPYQTIDTLKIAQREFGTTSHKQAWLTPYMGLPEKIETNFELWKRCMRGEQAALDEMLAYNQQDVRGLEALFLSLRGWAHGLPNMGILMDIVGEACGACGSQDLDWPEDKHYVTGVSRFSAFRCNECKSIGRSRFSDLTKEQRKSLTSSVAR